MALHHSVFPSLFDLIESDVEDGVSLPVFVVEVPPLEFIHGEALRFHRLAQRLAHAALLLGPAGIVRIGALGHLVVAAGHLDLMARARVVERQVYSAASVVARALARIGHKPFLVLRRGVPEDFGHRPRAVAVKNQQPVTFLAQPAVGARQGFGGGALQKRAALFVNRAAEKVIRSGVANIEFDRRVELTSSTRSGSRKSPFSFGISCAAAAYGAWERCPSCLRASGKTD